MAAITDGLPTYADLFGSTLAQAHSSGSGVVVLASGSGDRLRTALTASGAPAVSAARPLRFRLTENAAQGIIGPYTKTAIYAATGLSGDVLSGVTASEGSTDSAFDVGDVFGLEWTAGAYESLVAALGSVDVGAVLHVTGDETASGTKTFSTRVVTPALDATAVTVNDATLTTAAVSGTLNVTGAATFTAPVAASVTGRAYGPVSDARDRELLDWRFVPAAEVPYGDTFGVVAYDPAKNLWRRFVHHNTSLSGTSGDAVEMRTAPDWRAAWDSTTASSVIAPPGGSAWDADHCGVPFVWYEPGTTRPWRMLYRGGQNASGISSIGLATSVDGDTWERKDPAGNVLTAPIIAASVLGAFTVIDHGELIKHGTTYYLYVNPVGANSRALYLYTSTDLVSWRSYDSAPLFRGVTTYEDATHSGTPNSTYGFFCPAIFRHDRADGSTRFVMMVPHYIDGVTAEVQVYTAPSPVFGVAARTYVGKAFETVTSAYTIEGRTIVNCDTPRVVTDDVTRNVSTSTRTGSRAWCYLATNTATGWTQSWLVWDRTLHGSVCSGVDPDAPVAIGQGALPKHALAMPVTTRLCYLPGLTGNAWDYSSYKTHARFVASSITSAGFKLAGGTDQLVYVPPTGTIAAFDDLLNDWTLEATVVADSSWTSGARTVLHLGNGTYHVMWLYVVGSAGPLYTVNLTFTSGSSSHTITSDATSLTVGQTYRIAVTKASGVCYLFLDGVLIKQTSLNFVTDGGLNTKLYLGWNLNTTADYQWIGSIDEVRISSVARWTASYTAKPLVPDRVTSGSVYGPVRDWGAAPPTTPAVALAGHAPANSTLAVSSRVAANANDQSTTPGDFGTAAPSRYQQWRVAFTSDGTASPTVDALTIR